MARITVEDCLAKINNRFELVLIASKRARRLAQYGDDPKVAWENDKSTVVALREIAAGFLDKSYLDAEVNADAEAAGIPLVAKAEDEAV